MKVSVTIGSLVPNSIFILQYGGLGKGKGYYVVDGKVFEEGPHIDGIDLGRQVRDPEVVFWALQLAASYNES